MALMPDPPAPTTWIRRGTRRSRGGRAAGADDAAGSATAGTFLDERRDAVGGVGGVIQLYTAGTQINSSMDGIGVDVADNILSGVVFSQCTLTAWCATA